MMRCSDAVDLLLEETGSPELASHLATCLKCRSLAAAHRDALALQGLPVPTPQTLESTEVLGTVRRWRVRRLAVAGLALLGLAVSWPGLRSSQPEVATERATEMAIEMAPVEAPMMQQEPGLDMARAPTLTDLLSEVGSYTRREVATEDPTYSAFGAMARVFSPTPSQALTQHGFQESFPYYSTSPGYLR